MANHEDQRIKELTHQHWHMRNRAWSVEGLAWYIEELLPAEMDHAGQKTMPCHTLVLLVGFSPDPLLQSIWVYRPQRVLFLFNRDYWKDKRGKSLAGDYDQLIAKMQAQGFCDPAFAYDAVSDVAIAKTEATADWVFRELRDRVLLSGVNHNDVVIDITGAKKNMASGAFLFAAYIGAKISYVDFDEYDYGERRPLGYTCRIGEQTNPYDALGLRDWERVQRLYEQYAYGQAAAEVERLLQQMSASRDNTEYLTSTQQTSVQTLVEVLSMLDEWDNGDYTVAWNQWQALPATIQQYQEQLLPNAIKTLGSRQWPTHPTEPNGKSLLDQHRELKEGRHGIANSIFLQPSLVLTYAHDELDKIKRLLMTNNDYRSAFLRSAGLNELLLKARVAALWRSDQCKYQQKTYSEQTEQERLSCFKQIAQYGSAANMHTFLIRTPEQEETIRLERTNFEKYSGSQTMKSYWKISGCMDIDMLRKLRNEAIHTHLSIPFEYAHGAKETAHHALEDYKTHWLSNESFAYSQWEQPAWRDFCTYCQVHFLPTSIR